MKYSREVYYWHHTTHHYKTEEGTPAIEQNLYTLFCSNWRLTLTHNSDKVDVYNVMLRHQGKTGGCRYMPAISAQNPEQAKHAAVVWAAAEVGGEFEEAHW